MTEYRRVDSFQAHVAKPILSGIRNAVTLVILEAVEKGHGGQLEDLFIRKEREVLMEIIEKAKMFRDETEER